MLRTRLTKKYGLRRPLVSAGMSTATTPALIAAVCNAGGLGLHGVGDMPIDQLRSEAIISKRLVGMVARTARTSSVVT